MRIVLDSCCKSQRDSSSTHVGIGVGCSTMFHEHHVRESLFHVKPRCMGCQRCGSDGTGPLQLHGVSLRSMGSSAVGMRGATLSGIGKPRDCGTPRVTYCARARSLFARARGSISGGYSSSQKSTISRGSVSMHQQHQCPSLPCAWYPAQGLPQNGHGSPWHVSGHLGQQCRSPAGYSAPQRWQSITGGRPSQCAARVPAGSSRFVPMRPCGPETSNCSADCALGGR